MTTEKIFDNENNKEYENNQFYKISPVGQGWEHY